ncbi:hypothetical protein BH23PLA1_BH23PLA1_28630 [soil metagenome]
MLVSRRPILERRRGAAMVEAAIILPILAMFIFGLITGAMGIFYYQRVATLAREGARWASVRGGHFEFEERVPAATPQQVYQAAILPLTVGLNTDALTYTVTWAGGADKSPIYLAVPASNTWRRNHVRVTVSYQWTPLTRYFSPMTLRSTSRMPITY